MLVYVSSFKKHTHTHLLNMALLGKHDARHELQLTVAIMKELNFAISLFVAKL